MLIVQPKELLGFLVLLNQLIGKFKTSIGDILEEVYPVIAGRVFNILLKDVLPGGPGGNTEVCVIYCRLISFLSLEIFAIWLFLC